MDVAALGKEAVQMVEQLPYDLILMGTAASLAEAPDVVAVLEREFRHVCADFQYLLEGGAA